MRQVKKVRRNKGRGSENWRGNEGRRSRENEVKVEKISEAK